MLSLFSWLTKQVRNDLNNNIIAVSPSLISTFRGIQLIAVQGHRSWCLSEAHMHSVIVLV